jgi:outer membrane protein
MDVYVACCARDEIEFSFFGVGFMKFLLRCSVIVFALMPLHAAAQSLKIGYVNGARVESESALTKLAIEQMKKEFASRQQQLQDLQNQGSALQNELEKDGQKLPLADRQAKEKRLAALAQQFEQQQRSYVEDVETRQREFRAQVIGEINAIIKIIAEAGKFDLIVQQAIYSSQQIDITDQVLKEMAKRAGGATAPAK